MNEGRDIHDRYGQKKLGNAVAGDLAHRDRANTSCQRSNSIHWDYSGHARNRCRRFNSAWPLGRRVETVKKRKPLFSRDIFLINLPARSQAGLFLTKKIKFSCLE